MIRKSKSRLTRSSLTPSGKPPPVRSLSPDSRKGLFQNSDGLALVLTLMALALICAMVVEFSYEIYVQTAALHNWQMSQRLSLLARSGVKLASKTATERAAKYPYTYPGVLEISPPKVFDDYSADLSLRLEDENSKFNVKSLVFPNGVVNVEARNGLIRLLRALAVNPEMADRIIDWMDPDREPRLSNSENNSKNRPLDTADEIQLIPGIRKEDYERVAPYVTVYGTDLVNINGAPIPVLMSLSDSIDKGMAERVLRYRESLPFERPADLLKVAGFQTVGQALMGRISVQGTAFRVVSTAREGDVKRIIESIIDSNSIIQYWREF